MNAKETLKKIAEALNIVSDEKKEENLIEKTIVEDVVEETPETITEPATAEVVEVEEVKEAAPVVAEEPKEDPRIKDLEDQLESLKGILKNAMAAPQEEIVPEVKKEEPKGLTHSPERVVEKKSSGIGNKSSNIMDRVQKYINNN